MSGTDWTETDIVKQAIDVAGKYVMDEAARAFFWTVTFELGPRSPLAQLESPAEAVFAIAFSAHQLYEREFRLLRQVEVTAADQNYRFDFVVEWSAQIGRKGEVLPLAVEVDGHAFHEKTLEQVTRRNRRDRDVQLAGYTVMHFSFSELMRDPMGCAGEVYGAAVALRDKGV